MTTSESVRAPTVAAMVRARADDDNVGLVFGEQSWTWREVVAEAATRAAWMRATLDPDRPPHVGVLLPTVPEYVFQIFGAALAGACIVGVNSTRRGAELARDIEHTACQFVISDPTFGDLVDDPVAGRGRAVGRIRRCRAAGRRSAADRRCCFCSSRPARPRRPRPSNAARPGWPAVARRNGLRSEGRAVLPIDAGPRECVERHAVSRAGQRLPAGSARSVLGGRMARRRPIQRRDLHRPRSAGHSATSWRPHPRQHDRDHRLRAVLAPEASPRDTAEFQRAVRSQGGQRIRLKRRRHRAAARGQTGLTRNRARRRRHRRRQRVRRGMRARPVRFRRQDVQCHRGDRRVGASRRRRRVRRLLEQPRSAVRPTARRLVLVGRSGLSRRRRGVLVRRTRGGLASGGLGELRGQSRRAHRRPIRTTPRRSPSSGCRTRWQATRFWWPSSSLPGRAFDPDAFAAFLDAQSDLGTKWAPRFVRVMPELPVIGQGKIDKKPLRRRSLVVRRPGVVAARQIGALRTHDRCRSGRVARRVRRARPDRRVPGNRPD